MSVKSQRLLSGPRVKRCVICTACQWRGERRVLEDNTFGCCFKCGSPVVRRDELERKRDAKAKADLARMYPDSAQKDR